MRHAVSFGVALVMGYLAFIGGEADPSALARSVAPVQGFLVFLAFVFLGESLIAILWFGRYVASKAGGRR